MLDNLIIACAIGFSGMFLYLACIKYYYPYNIEKYKHRYVPDYECCQME